MTNQSHPQAFIDEMKAKLLAEQAELQQRLGGHSHQEHGDFQADYPKYGRSDEENADEVAEFLTTKATTEAEGTRLKELTAALERIAANTYGVTSDGSLISEARLRANPAATTIIAPE